MSGDDYLLDPRAPVAPEIAALEKALLPLRFRGGGPSERVLTVPVRRTFGPWPWVLVTTVAAAAALWLWLHLPSDDLYPGSPSRTYVSAKNEVQVHLGEAGDEAGIGDHGEVERRVRPRPAGQRWLWPLRCFVQQNQAALSGRRQTAR